MDVNGTSIVHEDLRMLRLIVDQDGASAPTLRETLGIDSSSTSSYRLDKLEEAGLITTHRTDSDHPGRLPRRVASPTDEGRQVVQALPAEADEAPETLTAEQRLERLERQFRTVRERLVTLQRRVDDVEQNQATQRDFVFEDSD